MVNTESHSTGGLYLVRGGLAARRFKQSQYGRIILPFTLLRRLECALEPTKAEVFNAAHTH